MSQDFCLKMSEIKGANMGSMKTDIDESESLSSSLSLAPSNGTSGIAQPQPTPNPGPISAPDSQKKSEIKVDDQGVKQHNMKETEERRIGHMDNNANNMDPQRRKVLIIVAHRRMLLERIKVCRKVTQARLDLYGEEDSHEIQAGAPGTATSTNIVELPSRSGTTETSTSLISSGKKKSQQESLITSRKRKFASKTKEIQTYQDLCKYAMAHTVKKHSTKSGGPTPRATAISLRTGSSVGNKMKAAVATLKNNAGWVSDSSSSMSANAPINRTVNGGGGGISPITNTVGNSSLTGTLNVKTSFSKSGSEHLPLHHQSTTSATGNTNGSSFTATPITSKSEVIPGQPQNVLSMKMHQTTNQNVKKMVPSTAVTNTSAIAPGKQVKKKSSASGKKRLGKIVRGNNSNIIPSSDKHQTGTTMPLHHGIVNDKRGQAMFPAKGTIISGTSTNGIQYGNKSCVPRIFCPEAERLRGQRRELTSKLDNLARKTCASDTVIRNDAANSIDIVNGRQTRSALPLSYHDDNPYYSAKKISWRSFMTADTSVCMLPRRRKTQWDYVLEEMRWLATDFIEENKWKRTSAKTLSTAITRHLKDTRGDTCSPSKQQNIEKSVPPLSLPREKIENFDDSKFDDVHADTISDTESNEGMDTDGASEEGISDDHLQYEQRPILEFVDPSEKDIQNVRGISDALSALIENHWDLTSTPSSGVPICKKDEQYAIAYSRYRELRRKKDDTQMESCLENKSDTVHRDSGLKIDSASPSPSDDTIPMPIQLAYDEIEKQISVYKETIKKMELGLAESFQNFHADMHGSLKNIGLELQQNQMEMLQFAEALWKDDDDNVKNSVISGLVINGPIASGKTFATGTLLWRRREKGPQLLICPGESLIRWRHELRRFSGLNVRTFGPNGWLYDGLSPKDAIDFSADDVVLCELSLVGHFISLCRRGSAVFVTVVVDTRCAALVPLQNRKDEDGDGLKVGKRKTASSKGKDISPCTYIAKEVHSSEWWNSIINDLVGPNTKCAVLETSGVVEGHAYLSQDRIFHTTRKENSDIFSFKVAFLYHQIFHSNKKAYGRRAFWWAKKYHKKSALDRTQLEVEPSDGVKGILEHLIDVLSYTPETNEDDIESIISSSIPKWTVLNCKLSLSQRKAYERACVFARGSLLHPDGNTIDAKNHLLLAKALLRLRRVCFHSNLHTPSSSDQSSGNQSQMNHTQHRLNESNTRTKKSSSQPDAAFAKSLLENSSKLRHLLNILYKDCGFDVVSKHFLFNTKPTRVGRKRSENKKRKKVLILATLPEVLLLISSFLNAIGIAHELLLPPNSIPCSSRASTDIIQDAISWVHCQQSIARFDDAFVSKKSPMMGCSVNVLVSSPITLGSASLGLSASNAEVVISVDEDWSGRCDFQTFSILRKNRTRNMKKSAGRRYIKLVADGTCEQSFLTFEKKGRGKKTVQAVPIMTSLLKSPCLDRHGTIHSNSSVILGKNLLRYSRVPLQKVFCSCAFPSSTLTGTLPLFLSGSDQEPLYGRDKKDDSDLVDLSDRSPLLLDDLVNDPSYVRAAGGRLNAQLFGESLRRIEYLATTSSYCGTITENTFVSSFLSGDTSVSIFSACRDVCSKQVQRYIMLRKRCFTNPGPYGDDKEGVIKKQKIVAAPPQAEKTKNGNEVTADDPPPPEIHRPVQIGVSGSKVEETVSALIWYEHDDVENCDPRDQVSEGCASDDKKRGNRYVRSYSSITRNCDGSQGCEGLVYFPPLFPGLLQANQASDDMPIELPTFSTSVGNQIKPPIVSHGKKRKGSSEGNASTKKPRTNSQVATPVPGFPIGVPNVTLSQVYPSQSLLAPTDLSMVAMNESDFMDSTMDLFDGGDILPDLTITKEEEIDTTLQKDSVADTTNIKSELNEDFGLLGSGFLPPLEESFKTARKLHGYNNPYSYWLDPFESLSSSYESFDYEEDKSLVNSSSKGLRLGSIILQVRKTKKPVAKPMHRTIPSMQGAYPMQASSSGGVQIPNGYFEFSSANQQAHSQKKKKKGGANEKRNSLGGHPGPFHTVGSIQATDPPMAFSSIPKDLNPHSRGDLASAINSLAHEGYPTVLLHHHLEDILDSGRNGDFDRVQLLSHGIFFPSKQNPLASPQSSIRELLPNEATGDCARKEADTQRERFCRDTLVSSDVDFGPFTVSVFPDSSIKDKIISLSSRVGIRLPMGVKVPKSINMFSKNKDDVWSKLEDDLLIEYANRLSFNWHAISQALTRKSRFSSCLDIETIVNPIRSAKQCKDRWKIINSSERIEEIKRPEMERASMKPEADLSSDAILLDLCRLSNVKTKPKHDDNAENRRGILKRLQRIKKASLKRHHIKLTIPGYTGGSHTPALQIVSSHPSHSQSVQAAIAHSAGPSGIVPPRAEMWPLQFLDLTEKQQQHVKKMRQAASAATSTSNTNNSAALSSKASHSAQSGSSTSRQQTHPPTHQSSVPNPRPSSRGQTHSIARPVPTNAQGTVQIQQPQQGQIISHTQSSQKMLKPGKGMGGKGPSGH